MNLSGELHALAALPPARTPVPIGLEVGCRKISCLSLDSNPGHPVRIARKVLWAVKLREEHTLRVLQVRALRRRAE
jgi:hypothetical protein